MTNTPTPTPALRSAIADLAHQYVEDYFPYHSTPERKDHVANLLKFFREARKLLPSPALVEQARGAAVEAIAMMRERMLMGGLVADSEVTAIILKHFQSLATENKDSAVEAVAQVATQINPRKMAGGFLNLTLGEKLDIAEKLGLRFEGDVEKHGIEMDKAFFRVAVERKLLQELSAAIDQARAATGKGQT